MSNTLQYESDSIGYNVNKDTQKEGTMPTDTLQDLGEDIRIHATDAILERKSDLFGMVKIYPPVADPKEWAEHSWLLTTDTDAEGNKPGLNVRIKAKYVSEVLERPHFLNTWHKFGEADREPEPTKEHQKWDIEVPDRKVEEKDFTFDD